MSAPRPRCSQCPLSFRLSCSVRWARGVRCTSSVCPLPLRVVRRALCLSAVSSVSPVCPLYPLPKRYASAVSVSVRGVRCVRCLSMMSAVSAAWTRCSPCPLPVRGVCCLSAVSAVSAACPRCPLSVRGVRCVLCVPCVSALSSASPLLVRCVRCLSMMSAVSAACPRCVAVDPDPAALGTRHKARGFYTHSGAVWSFRCWRGQVLTGHSHPFLNTQECSGSLTVLVPTKV